jgi:transposase
MSRLPISERKRIERAHALKGKIVIGVDPASRKHTAITYSAERLPLSNAINISNDRQGFETFAQSISKLKERYPEQAMIFAIEASAEYWKPMWHYFAQRGYHAVLVPSMFVKKTRDLDDYTPRSNDPKDAARIANLAFEGRYFVPTEQTELFCELRHLVRTWEQLSDHMVIFRQRLTSLMVVYFPEYLGFFSNIASATSSALLKTCPFPKDLLAFDREQLLSIIITSSHKMHGAELAASILENANQSVGLSTGLEGARLRLQVLIEQIEITKAQMVRVRRELAHKLTQIEYSKRILSISGIGPIGVARFLGNLGDLRHFDKIDKVIDIAGLSLISSESGQFKSKRQISRRGRSGLRCILYELACHFVRFPNAARRKYLVCRIKGKTHRQAIVSTIPQMLRTIFAVVMQDRDYLSLNDDDPLAKEIASLEHLWHVLQKKQKKAA